MGKKPCQLTESISNPVPDRTTSGARTVAWIVGAVLGAIVAPIAAPIALGVVGFGAAGPVAGHCG